MSNEEKRPKQFPVDCTNDYVMVKEGLRPPKLRHEPIERDPRSLIKSCIKAWKKAQRS